MATSPDLVSLARNLVRVHDAVLAGDSPPERPRELVARSWRRTMGLGVDPEGRGRRDPLTAALVDARRRGSRLSLVLDTLRAPLLAAADASSYLVVVTDADGIVLWRSGAPRAKAQADRLGFIEGAVWTEAAVGTNAIGTALAERAPVQLFAAEHFENAQVPWYCTAEPIHDPIDGSLLGVIDVSGPALTLHPAIRALVTAAVQLAEAGLWRQHAQSLEQLRRTAMPLLASSNGPLLVVDDHGWVAAQQGIAFHDRLQAPHADRTIAVPGMGVCLPERLHGGWLLRPATGATTVHAHLETVGQQAVLDIYSGDASWRVPLSPRHAQLVTALVDAGPRGATASALSALMFGDAEHQVTVRAEFSRLRRSIGAIVASNPYRIADGVSVTAMGR